MSFINTFCTIFYVHIIRKLISQYIISTLIRTLYKPNRTHLKKISVFNIENLSKPSQMY